MQFRILGALFLALALLFPTRAVAQYVAVDLAPNAGFSFAYAVNNHGQVVGRTLSHAFLWESGVMHDLGTLPGGSYSEAFGINDLGQVVGWSTIDDATCTLFDGCWHAFLWENGTMTDLGGLDSRFQSYAYSINNRGQIVGISATGDYPTGTWRAVMWDHGTVTDLGEVSGATNMYAHGINDRGMVSGSFDGPDGQRAVLWANGVPTLLNFGASFNDGAKINNAGAIAGFGQPAGRTHAVLWRAGTLTDLGTLPGATWSFGRDINDRTQVVGESFFASTGNTRGFVWQDGTMTNLGTLPGGRDSYAQGINGAGVIVGASDNGGFLHAVMWIPARR